MRKINIEIYETSVPQGRSPECHLKRKFPMEYTPGDDCRLIPSITPSRSVIIPLYYSDHWFEDLHQCIEAADSNKDLLVMVIKNNDGRVGIFTDYLENYD